MSNYSLWQFFGVWFCCACSSSTFKTHVFVCHYLSNSPLQIKICKLWISQNFELVSNIISVMELMQRRQRELSTMYLSNMWLINVHCVNNLKSSDLLILILKFNHAAYLRGKRIMMIWKLLWQQIHLKRCTNYEPGFSLIFQQYWTIWNKSVNLRN